MSSASGRATPDYVTAQAVDALNDTHVFFAMDKGLGTAARTTWWRCAARSASASSANPATGSSSCPTRRASRTPRTAPAYLQAVADWHAARADVWARALRDELPDDGVGAFLAWGDPSLYDSTLRILDWSRDRSTFTFDVMPGITAIQALTARHRIPLNDVGEPVLITTGRRLRADGLAGAAVVMLDGDCAFLGCPPCDEDLVGRLPRHAERVADRGYGRRRGRAHRDGPRRGSRAARLDHGHLSVASLRPRRPWQDHPMGRFLVRAGLTGFALWVVTRVVPGHRVRRRRLRPCRGSGSSSSWR